MSAGPTAAGSPEGRPGLMERMLDVIERVGNKVPHPAILFLGPVRRHDPALAGAVLGRSQRDV